MGTEGSFPGCKWLGREAGHSPSSTAEIKNSGAIPQLPHMSLIKHGDNFTFTFRHTFEYVLDCKYLMKFEAVHCDVCSVNKFATVR
jgi:hypothetical protein